jgi:hypothetical protein
MATRDSQTFQIIIISLCFLLVLTGVAAVFGWRYYTEAQSKLADAETEKQNREEAFREQLAVTTSLKQFLGFKDEDNHDTIKGAYDEDMKVLGATYSDDNKNYRTIAQQQNVEIAQLTAAEKTAQENFQTRDREYLALEAESKSRVDEFQKKSQEETAAAAAARQTFEEDRAKFERERKELLDLNEQQKSELAMQLAEKDAEITRLTTELRDKDQRIADLQAGRQQDHTVFERPDGEVTLVNQASRQVWVNLGYADALREQISFSVYDELSPVAGQNEPKAKIEVIRIVDDHLAVARIIDDEPLNPIVSGDKIYSPVWERGKQVRFALTGQIDFDGDGRDDSERARQLITSNGGVVDAYVNEQGAQVGQMTINTRFLVVGEEPNEGRDAELLDAKSQTRQAMLQEADDKDIDQISVDKFLSFVGWHADGRVVALGSGAKGSDFPPAPRDQGSRSLSTGSTADAPATELFRKRYPVTPY